MSQKKSLKELTLLDRFQFAETMENPENLKILLDIILEDDILLKGLPQTEKELRKSSLYRYAKVDIWAMDEQDTIYDAEVQGKNTGNLLKRTRYYQAMLDSQLLKPGDTDFNKLNRSVIILIAPFDLFGYGLYRYTFVGQCLEIPGLHLEDDSTRIFLNTHGTNPEGVRPELIDLLHYMEHTNEKSLSFANDKLSALQQNVKSVQENAEIGVRYMQLWEEFVEKYNEGQYDGWQHGHDRGIKEGHEAGLKEGHEAGLKEGHEAGLKEGHEAGRIRTSIEFILDILGSLGEIPTYLQKRITSETDISLLKVWMKKVARAKSIEDFEKEIL